MQQTREKKTVYHVHAFHSRLKSCTIDIVNTISIYYQNVVDFYRIVIFDRKKKQFGAGRNF